MIEHSQSSTPRRGALYLVSTPIGNLEDISLRALRILREADLIACEDTRQSQKLLSHYEIHNKLISCHEHNESERAPELVSRMEQGARIALVTDAGTPSISDPGYRLVRSCLEHEIPVIPIPGPSALTAALAASGFATDEFTFVGFPPRVGGKRRKSLEKLKTEPRTLIFYEAPHRVMGFLEDAFRVFGNRRAVIAREVTKVYEEFLRGNLGELLDAVRRTPLRGEITVLIAGASGESTGGVGVPHTIAERIEQIAREQGLDPKTALKKAAREHGLTRREAYKQWIVSRGKADK